MAGKFIGPGVDLEQAYVNDYSVIDEFAMTGSLWSIGYNTSGQLGINSTLFRSSPVQTISGGTNWKQISCGDQYTAAIKTDGTLWLWGAGTYGQLGNNAITNRSSPVQTISAGTNWKQVAGSYSTTAAIKTDGTLWLWGAGTYGQLGNNAINNRSSPVQTISGGNNWKQVAGGAGHIAAIKTDGTLWTWGRNAYGQLGDNTTTYKSSPVQTIAVGTNWKQVSCGYEYTTAIKTDGTLWSWGDNSRGQLGTNSTLLTSSPVQTISGGTNWKQVDDGIWHTAAIKTDGTLWSWGYNSDGELGNNDITRRSSPVQTISGGTNWKQVACGYYHTTAIKTDGTLWTWGNNGSGQLGNNDLTHRSSPVQTIAGGTNWKQVDCKFEYTVAIHFYDAGNLYPSN